MRKSFAEEGDLLYLVENTNTAILLHPQNRIDFVGGCNIVAQVTEKLTWEMVKCEPLFLEIDNPKAEYRVSVVNQFNDASRSSAYNTTGIGFWTKEDILKEKKRSTGKVFPSALEHNETIVLTHVRYGLAGPVENLSRMSVEQILTHRVANKNFLPYINRLLKLDLDLENFE